jgi:hypothetical protein
MRWEKTVVDRSHEKAAPEFWTQKCRPKCVPMAVTCSASGYHHENQSESIDDYRDEGQQRMSALTLTAEPLTVTRYPRPGSSCRQSPGSWRVAATDALDEWGSVMIPPDAGNTPACVARR